MTNDKPYKLDAPYYAGHVLVHASDIVSIIVREGGITIVLRGGGTVRAVNNAKAQALSLAAGFGSLS